METGKLTTTWPSSGAPTISFDEPVGIYSRSDQAFLRIDEYFKVIADDRNYDGIGNDEFTIIMGDDGSVAIKASNGNYLTASDYGVVSGYCK